MGNASIFIQKMDCHNVNAAIWLVTPVWADPEHHTQRGTIPLKRSCRSVVSSFVLFLIPVAFCYNYFFSANYSSVLLKIYFEIKKSKICVLITVYLISKDITDIFNTCPRMGNQCLFLLLGRNAFERVRMWPQVDTTILKRRDFKLLLQLR